VPPALQLHRESFSQRPGFDTAVSHALLRAVAAGEAAESFRLYRPADALAFSGLDRRSEGFGRAAARARAAGFEPLLRLTGGRAAAFERTGVAFAWSVQVDELRSGIHERFAATAELVRAALCDLGVDARIGEVAGEYCPGEYSVNARGRRKLMGVGQRVVRGAAHVGGVIVVEGAERVRGVLCDVYAELGHSLAPETVGGVADEVATCAADIEEAIIARLAARYSLEEAAIGSQHLARAEVLAPKHEDLAMRAMTSPDTKLAIER
jgi:lipoate-protein ligase A